MTFTSIVFLVFISIVLFLLSRCKTNRQQQMIIFLADVIFYVSWDVRCLSLLFFQILICYIVSQKIRKKKSKKMNKCYVVIAICSILIVLCLFKYYGFFISAFRYLFPSISTISLKLVLPIGISFYSFMAISYVVDVYKGNLEANDSLLEIALYLSFFPHIISGPISLSRKFLPQLKEYHPITRKGLEEGIQIFLFGLVKKLVIADRLAVYTDTVFATPAAFNGFSLFCTVIAYSIQLYCDFSGYSDMAIGIAHVMGFTLPKNFNMPYLAKNPTEFWKRWHISLSSWLQEYIYFSLGGNRKGSIRTYVNLMITMLLGGLWHGADWKFVFWGGLHGLALVLHKDFRKWTNMGKVHIKHIYSEKIINVLFIILNCLFVCFCWIFFRADSLSDAFLIIQRIVGNASGVYYVSVYFVIFLIAIVICYGVGVIKNKGNGYYILLDLQRFLPKVAICMVILFIAVFGYFGSNVFIYSQF